jgi:hypothetical protein
MAQSSVCRALTLGIFLALAVASAHAADFTFFVGGVNPGDFKVSGIPQSLDGSAVIGGRLSHAFLPFLGMEHTVAFSPDYLFPNNAPGVTDSKGFVYSADVILNLPVGKVIPYATAGVGFLHQYGSENLPVGTKPALNYGGGIKIPGVFGPLGLRFDARGYAATGGLNLLEVSAGVRIGF